MLEIFELFDSEGKVIWKNVIILLSVGFIAIPLLLLMLPNCPLMNINLLWIYAIGGILGFFYALEYEDLQYYDDKIAVHEALLISILFGFAIGVILTIAVTIICWVILGCMYLNALICHLSLAIQIVIWGAIISTLVAAIIGICYLCHTASE